MSARFSIGEIVALRGTPDINGPVIGIDEDGAEPRYQLFLGPHEKRWYPERSLVPAQGEEADAPDPSDALALLRAWRLADAPALQTYFTLRKLKTADSPTTCSRSPPRGRSACPTNFKPVLKLLDGPAGRLLVADEVGLGKTIEAGIVLSELRARRQLDTALVACPRAC